MSYNFRIRRTEAGIELVPEDIAEPHLVHIPVGTFTVSGHSVPEGEKGHEWVAVSHSDGHSTSASFPRDRTKG